MHDMCEAQTPLGMKEKTGSFRYDLLRRETYRIFDSLHTAEAEMRFLNKSDSPFRSEELGHAITKIREAVSWLEKVR